LDEDSADRHSKRAITKSVKELRPRSQVSRKKTAKEVPQTATFYPAGM